MWVYRVFGYSLFKCIVLGYMFIKKVISVEMVFRIEVKVNFGKWFVKVVNDSGML